MINSNAAAIAPKNLNFRIILACWGLFAFRISKKPHWILFFPFSSGIIMKSDFKPLFYFDPESLKEPDALNVKVPIFPTGLVPVQVNLPDADLSV